MYYLQITELILAPFGHSLSAVFRNKLKVRNMKETQQSNKLASHTSLVYTSFGGTVYLSWY